MAAETARIRPTADSQAGKEFTNIGKDYTKIVQRGTRQTRPLGNQHESIWQTLQTVLIGVITDMLPSHAGYVLRGEKTVEFSRAFLFLSWRKSEVCDSCEDKPNNQNNQQCN